MKKQPGQPSTPFLHDDPTTEEQIQLAFLLLLVLMLGVGGTISNALSLSYFIRKERHTLVGKLMISLNCADLLVCFSAMATWIFLVLLAVKGDFETYKTLFKYFPVLFKIFVESTAFLTCLLSVSRTIKVVFPFYKLRKIPMVFFPALFHVLLVFTQFLPMIGSHWINLNQFKILTATKLLLIIFIVLICLGTCVIRLQFIGGRHTQCATRRRATVTIMLISAAFCTVNMANVVPYFADVSAIYIMYSSFVCVPFNSAINPIIYFSRKKQMREYARRTCMVVCCVLCTWVQGRGKREISP